MEDTIEVQGLLMEAPWFYTVNVEYALLFRNITDPNKFKQHVSRILYIEN
jgi:hypothetical protein